jgi:DUF4097 and DUF4098 domain-containing protein YvlB
MRQAVFALGVLIAGSAVLPAAATETEHITQTAPLAPGGTLRVKNFSGHVAITGTDRQDASIDAVRRANRERLDHIKLDIHMEGSALVVSANKQDYSYFNWSRSNRVVETDLVIQVPRRTSLEADLFSAALSVDGLDGTHNVHAFSSRVKLENMAGSIRVHTFSGPVDVRTTTWRPNQSVDIDTFSGNVELHVPDNAGGTVSFNSFSGHLNSEIPLTLRSGSRRSIRADLGPASAADRGTLRFKTFSGSVKINR